MKITKVKVKFPRKKKKQLLKSEKFPQFVQIIEVENKTIGSISCVLQN